MFGLQGILVSWVVGWIIDLMHAQVGQILWDKFEAELDAKIKSAIPSSWIDAQLIALAHAILGVVKGVLVGGVMDQVVKLVAAGQLKEAAQALEQAVIGSVFPVLPA